MALNQGREKSKQQPAVWQPPSCHMEERTIGLKSFVGSIIVRPKGRKEKRDHQRGWTTAGAPNLG